MAGEYDITEAFKRIEDELIASMIRNMEGHRVKEAAEGKEWSMWQAEQLKALEKYKVQNQKKYKKQFLDINQQIAVLIRQAKDTGSMQQEISILNAIQKGFSGAKKTSQGLTGEFFRLNERKLEALIKATVEDMEKAENAILRRANDQYRKSIYSAQVYANTGAGTYEKAVDMATKDMLASGLTCVKYANGAMHSLSDYADMAIRTAGKRAYLQGEGLIRQEWGISTVIINKRGNPCPLCLPFAGKVLIDDVWSGGKASDGPYPLMSKAISKGLYHPRCQDHHTTYFPDFSETGGAWTKEELEAIENTNRQAARRQYAARQAAKQGRMSKHSLDPGNKWVHKVRQEQWEEEAKLLELKEKIRTGGKVYKAEAVPEKKVAKGTWDGIIKLSEEERYALNQYFGFESYKINEKLRKGLEMTEQEKEMIRYLDNALKKIPYYEGELSRSLYFGQKEAIVEFMERYRPGNDISFMEFISTTRDTELYNPEGEVQIFIRNAKKGRNVSLVLDKELEVLYERGAKFRVISVTEFKEQKWIILEET
ncbi:MAG: minor capsid protein [Lachnospiraceae bacterium]|nr:minor capsid protein [Lachnospiraceae bacterium]